jgi:hypothetical protein
MVMSVLPLLWHSLKFLKLLLPFIIAHVLHVFNHSITCSVFLIMWKSVIVRPVAEIASPSCPSNFRQITIVSALSKGFERFINGQVLAHVDHSGLLAEFQSGFKCDHSTTTALVRDIEDLRFSMSEERVTVLVLMDFSKAFDCVDYHLFLHKLVLSFDFHGSARDMVSTFLNGRSMFVEGRSEGPRYLYSDLCRARSSRTANFIFPNVCPRGSVLVSSIRLWNGVPLVIKESRSVAIFQGAVLARLKTV